MTKFEITYHNAETDNECGFSYDADTLIDALDTASFFRKNGEYIYITNTETNETFLTDDGATLAVVPEV